ncbi:MAG: hypothetical protein GH143_04215 [Calditrichaeota bacterium]|nr:hypothetical protein [Calditrichota bacterium]
MAKQTTWPKENIPDRDDIYRRIPKYQYRKDGTIGPGAFKDKGDSMSTYWSKYSTPHETKNLAAESGVNPDDFGVVALNVGDVKEIPQQVEHTPFKHRAHTSVIGDKTLEVRARFIKMSRWMISIIS